MSAEQLPEDLRVRAGIMAPKEPVRLAPIIAAGVTSLVISGLPLLVHVLVPSIPKWLVTVALAVLVVVPLAGGFLSIAIGRWMGWMPLPKPRSPDLRDTVRVFGRVQIR